MSKKITKKVSKKPAPQKEEKVRVKISKEIHTTAVFNLGISGREVEIPASVQEYVLDANKRLMKAQELLKSFYEA